MFAYCLASSSAGNCYILSFEGMPPLMVECGIPYSKILSRANSQGIKISDIRNCLVTHAHKDHSFSSKELHKRGINVWSSKDTFDILDMVGGCLLHDKVPTTVQDGLKIMAFSVDHDCPGSVGFVIKTKSECVLFINDHKKWNTNLRNFKPDYVFIECNHEHTMVYAQYYQLKKAKKEGVLTDSEKLKLQQIERNINSHCSLHGTLKGLEKLNLSKTKCIFLMHLSNRWANEYKMKMAVEKATRIQTLVCGRDGGIK